jgi:hypothetical protein
MNLCIGKTFTKEYLSSKLGQITNQLSLTNTV